MAVACAVAENRDSLKTVRRMFSISAGLLVPFSDASALAIAGPAFSLASSTFSRRFASL